MKTTLLILAALYLAHRAYRSHARRVDRAWTGRHVKAHRQLWMGT